MSKLIKIVCIFSLGTAGAVLAQGVISPTEEPPTVIPLSPPTPPQPSDDKQKPPLQTQASSTPNQGQGQTSGGSGKSNATPAPAKSPQNLSGKVSASTNNQLAEESPALWLSNFVNKVLEGRSAFLYLAPGQLMPTAKVITSIGLLAGLGEILPSAILDTSLSDLYLQFLRLFGGLFGLLGLRKRAPWGTVYDSVTKRPIDPAVVTALQNNKEVQDAITDLDGRYALFLPTGNYTLQVGKTNYLFPSRKLVGKTNDLFYNNLYFGGEIPTREGDLITRDIPMDPINFDWNEFTKNKQQLYTSFLQHELVRRFVFKTLFIFGLAGITISTYFDPSNYNYTVIAAFVIIYGLQKFVSLRHRPSTLIDHKTGGPLSFAIVHLYGAKSHIEHKRVITDEVGCFFMLVSPGIYYLIVDIRQPAGWYHSIKQNGIIHLRHGILPRKVRVHGTDISFANED